MPARRTQILLVTLIALVAVLAAYLVGTGRPPRDPGARGVVTVGKGSITAEPDQLSFSLTVSHTADDTATAMEQTTAGLKAVKAALTKSGVETKDVRTTNVSVNPRYSYSKGNNRITGYSSAQTLTVLVRDLDKAGEVMGMVVTADGNAVSLGNVSLKVGKKAELIAQARAKAIRDSRKAAKALAEAAGRDVGSVVFIDEMTSGGGGYRFQANSNALRGMLADSADFDIPIEAGEQKVSVQVKVRWSLK